MTPELQQKLDSALAQYQAAQNAEQTALQQYNTLADKAAACQKARDQYNFGPAKNNACHIDTLTMLNKQRDAAQVKYQNAVAFTKSAKANYDAIKAEVAAAAQLAIDTNPEVVLANQNLTAQQSAQTATAADNESKRKSQQKIAMIVGFSILGVAIVVFVIWKVTR